MKIRRSGFHFQILAEDLVRIRNAIPYWNPTFNVSKFDGAMLYDCFEAWLDFTEDDWLSWDRSEYRQEINCRFWIQLAIEYSTARTSTNLLKQVASIDDIFKSKMKRLRASEPRKTSDVFKIQPYFWQVYTIHPDEM